MKRLLLLAPLLLAACSSSDPIEPPAPLTVILKPGLQIEHLWSKRVDGRGANNPKLVPLVDGERVFVANAEGRIEARNTANGELLWRSELGTAVLAGPGEGDDLLLFGADSEVIAISKKDGHQLWRSPVSSEVLSIPQRDGNVVVVQAVDGNIVALNAGNGAHLWQFHERVPTLSLRGCGEPLLVGGAAFVGTASGKVIALSLRDGRLLWETVVAEPRGHTELERLVDVDAQLAYGGGVIYAASYQGNMVALAANSGQLYWSRGIGSHTGMVVGRNNLYLTDSSGDVLALSRRNGGTMWKQTALHARTLGIPVEQGNYLLIGDYDGYLHWLSKEDGSIVARSRIETWQEYWPTEDMHYAFTDFYQEDRAVQAPPAVKGTQVFGLDRRGVLDVFKVTAGAAGSR